MGQMRYVELPGNTVARLPYLAHGATLQTMFFASEEHLLQRICNRVLNERAGNGLRFRAMLPVVVFTALYAERMTSDDPIDKSKGYVKEADIGFWIMVQGGEASKPLTWREYLLPVYLFVDSGAAVSAGREVFGYPKLLGRFERQNSIPDDDARVEVHTQHFTKFGPTEEALVGPIFALERIPSAKLALASRSEEEISDQLSARFLAPPMSRPRKALDFTPYGAVLPMIFLKQFRGLTRPNTACYQAVASVDTRPLADPEPKYKPLSHGYALRLWPSASHPITDDLGVKSGQAADTDDIPPFQYEMSFTVGFGSVLWEKSGDSAEHHA